MPPIYSFGFVVTVVCAIFFYRAALMERAPGLLWATLSVAVSITTWQGFGWGVFAMFLSQLALFLGIGVFRALRAP